MVMDLSKAIGKHAKNTLYGWNKTLGTPAWEDTGLLAGLHVYDRFISDREFGQKKRVLTLAGENKIDEATYRYVRVGTNGVTYMLEKFNEDYYANNNYGSFYVLHEASTVIEIGKMTGTGRASGSGGKKTFTPEQTVWGDFQRYVSIGSREFDGTDYTVTDVFLPLDIVVDSDHILKFNNNQYDVVEVSRLLNLQHLRAQKYGVDQNQS